MIALMEAWFKARVAVIEAHAKGDEQKVKEMIAQHLHEPEMLQKLTDHFKKPVPVVLKPA